MTETYTNKNSKEIEDFINKRAKEINAECGFDLLPPCKIEWIKENHSPQCKGQKIGGE